MASVIAFGETMVDIYMDSSAEIIQLGGACANLVSGVALLGGRSAIIERIVNDSIGNWIKNQLKNME